MNIFILSRDPAQAAKWNLDKHVVKMPLEVAQLLSTSLRIHGCEDTRLYKVTHRNHPCAIWARETKQNFLWLCDHGDALCTEYTARYGKVHKSGAVIKIARTLSDYIPAGDLTPFALAMPDECKGEDPVESYRAYYKGHKNHLFAWKLNRPDWA